MTELWKTRLSFVLRLYYLAIVTVLTILGNFSPRLSNTLLNSSTSYCCTPFFFKPTS